MIDLAPKHLTATTDGDIKHSTVTPRLWTVDMNDMANLHIFTIYVPCEGVSPMKSAAEWTWTIPTVLYWSPGYMDSAAYLY
ncbi:hypothetical protein N7493_001368 [Penicillium malachiteum]|uniref:Uncharacterized protein n=1 Tax=Penicillium malachiteum TaxID=1324776 RepID=A0AAD6MZV8_9EURO|nr:hypothetical protein N7493_001368 [Penicillium malachiteum]